MMRFLILGLLVATTSSQTTRRAIDPNVWIDIFGPPPSSTPASLPSTTQLDNNNGGSKGQPCECIPNYHCIENPQNTIAEDVIDIRVGDDDPPQCPDPLYTCCDISKNSIFKQPDTTTPQPAPNTPHPDPVIPEIDFNKPTSLKGCGYRNPNGIGAYLPGPSTQFGEYPWVVALLDAKNGSYAGVGALIHPQVVITGAHIAYKFAPGDLKIRAGEWDTQTTNESLDFQERTVNDINLHPEFTRKKLKNDIALLRLEKPVDLADHIDIICTPELDEGFDNHKGCIANGWGKNSFGKSGIYSEILKSVEVDMVPHTRCEILMKRTRLGSRFRLHDSFICAGGEEGKDTCQGDGGAPLACPMGDNRYKLTGLVSWGIGCGQQDIPAVYTDVAKFRVWVQQKMKVWGLRVTTYRPDI